MIYHKPVLSKECIEGLAIHPEGTYVDATYGGGGHAREILKKLTTGKLYAFDQDEEAQKNKIEDERLVLLRQNFRYMKNFLRMYNALPVDGILADLGVSSYQLDTAERGFSTRFDAPLDMRMDRNIRKTAGDIIRSYQEDELKRLFWEYGEVENAGKLSRTIIEKRNVEPIETIKDLKEAIAGCIKRGKEHQYLAKVFQALRIEVNKELDALKDFLLQAKDVLRKGGRLVVISYHSLEDRLVKNFMQKGKFEGEIEKDFYGNPLLIFKVVNRKPIVPTAAEIVENNRARSAKLRIAEKI